MPTMKTGTTGAKTFSRGFFILAVLGAASLLPPASYSAGRDDDEHLISLPEKKPATTKPKITTQKKETPAQPAEPAKPASRQSLLGGRNSEPDPAATEPEKNGRSGLMRGPGTGRKKTDGDEEQPQRDPSLTKTVSRHSEGSTDYETTTEYDGDTEIETEVVTEHIRGMIVETTTVTEKKAGKVVRKTKSKTTRKEGAAAASTDKQTKSILGRATDNAPKDTGAAATGRAASKPVSSGKTTTATGSAASKPVSSGKTTTATGKTAVSAATAEEKTETPPVDAESAKDSVEEPVPAEETKEPESLPVSSEPEEPAESSGTVPDDDKKEPDSEQKSGTVGNPFGVVRQMNGDQD